MENGVFKKEELERYSRHLILPKFGIEGQQKLKHTKVLVIGSGGLGAPLLLYLAAAGIGKIGIVDFDVVDDSNLQRQVLFTVDDVGKPKVEVAKKRLEALNPHIQIEAFNERLASDNVERIFKSYDIVADGTDNFPTRYLINDACYFYGKVNVSASIFRFEGQVSVYNYLNEDGSRGPNYRDLYPEPPPPGLVPSCAEGGVIGVLPGIIGSLQANEVIKVAANIGEPLVGKLLVFDALTLDSRVFKFEKNKDNPVSGTNPSINELIDYEAHCGIIKTEKKSTEVKEKSVEELKKMKDGQEDFQLIDVREQHEYDIVNIDGKLIPLGDILQHASEISREKPVIVHCRSGVRSATAIAQLEKEFGFENLYNLKGGVLAYADEIDPSLPKY
ncbi:MAG: molybdopterin-synthase adenylyltransferase MoeB [Chitinophagales bacterium]|nr:molybdopterin-synthase adenylyltransferase MoeB [Chitinophagales bacterium]